MSRVTHIDYPVVSVIPATALNVSASPLFRSPLIHFVGAKQRLRLSYHCGLAIRAPVRHVKRLVGLLVATHRVSL
ncbi:hypothetical protein ABNE98_21630 [Paenibacillus larvae]